MPSVEDTYRYIKDAAFTDGGSMKDAASRVGMGVFGSALDNFDLLARTGATEFHKHLLSDIRDFAWNRTWNEGAWLLPQYRFANFTNYTKTRNGRFYVNATCTMPEVDASPGAMWDVVSTATAASVYEAFTKTNWEGYLSFVHSVGIFPGEGQSDRGINFLVVPEQYDPAFAFRAIQEEEGRYSRFARFASDMHRVEIGMSTKDAIWWEKFEYIGLHGNEEVGMHVWANAWDEPHTKKTRFTATQRAKQPKASSIFSWGQQKD